jgi:ADP-ribose pyrophosphatase YjhB (NUDIX family)
MLFQSHAGRVADVTSPGPEPAARVRPVVIDPAARRFLLVPSHGVSPLAWSLPTYSIRPGESLHRATARHLRRELGLPALRIVPVTGRLPASGRRPWEEYFVLVAPVGRAWPCDVRSLLAPGARWWTTVEARGRGVQVEPEVLLDLIDGYWEGWLPDGVVSLE